ncbi:hypothetical protein DM02DRAFT_302036 [Periconia macrospinosa]|uniref:Uncharacterized protein n=1 Tax=Periconia macrospinosa TaxID=97972 RepID=A0A2V1DWF3_9PLEO|nr:hypothetical protein DM02DRAFT_302036 [Periconia macrospinosa]
MPASSTIWYPSTRQIAMPPAADRRRPSRSNSCYDWCLQPAFRVPALNVHNPFPDPHSSPPPPPPPPPPLTAVCLADLVPFQPPDDSNLLKRPNTFTPDAFGTHHPITVGNYNMPRIPPLHQNRLLPPWMEHALSSTILPEAAARH